MVATACMFFIQQGDCVLAALLFAFANIGVTVAPGVRRLAAAAHRQPPRTRPGVDGRLRPRLPARRPSFSSSTLAWTPQPEAFGLSGAALASRLSFLERGGPVAGVLHSPVPGRCPSRPGPSRRTSGRERAPSGRRSSGSGETLRDLRGHRQASVMLMLLAFLIYNAGIGTIIRNPSPEEATIDPARGDVVGTASRSRLLPPGAVGTRAEWRITSGEEPMNPNAMRWTRWSVQLAIMLVAFQNVTVAQPAPVSFDELVASAVAVQGANGSGSGVLVSDASQLLGLGPSRPGHLWDLGPGIIVTNEHITRGSRAVQVIFPAYADGTLQSDRRWYQSRSDLLRDQGTIVRGLVVYAEPWADLALVVPDPFANVMHRQRFGGTGVRIDARDVRAYMAGRQGSGDVPCARLQPGQQVFYLGNPGSLMWRFGSGRLRNADATCDKIILDGSVHPGNSGSVVVDAEGFMLGILRSEAERGSVGVAVSLRHVFSAFDTLRYVYLATIVNRTNRNVEYIVANRAARTDVKAIGPGECHPLLFTAGTGFPYVYASEGPATLYGRIVAGVGWSVTGPLGTDKAVSFVHGIPCSDFLVTSDGSPLTPHSFVYDDTSGLRLVFGQDRVIGLEHSARPQP